MHWLRTTWGMRCIAGLFLSSLLPLVCVPMVHAGHYGSSLSYADWVEDQISAPGDELESALSIALEAQPASIDDFLAHFADAYVSEVAGAPDVVRASPLPPDDALVAYLKSRFIRLVGSALLPKLLIKSAQARHITSTDRNDVVWALTAPTPFQRAVWQFDYINSARIAPVHVHPHLLTEARPSAP